MKKKFISKLRSILWRILGPEYLKFLEHQKVVYSEDSPCVSYGKMSYDNGSKVWSWSDNPKLKIGNFCSIANDVNFILDSGYHALDMVSTFPFVNQVMEDNIDIDIEIDGKMYSKEALKKKIEKNKTSIIIDNDVWIGSNVTVLPGVHIKNGVVCLAGSVITKDVEAYAIVGGVPAKTIKYRFKESEIINLENIQWWNWSENKIRENIQDFYIPISEFCNKYKKS